MALIPAKGHTGRSVGESEFYTEGVVKGVKDQVVEELEPMLYEIGESAKQGAVDEAAVDATTKADAAQSAAEATASADATAKADAAEADAKAYTDAELAGLDLDELAELSREIEILDDTVVADPAAASFDLSNVVPVGAVIVSVQVRLDTEITGVGGATKVGIGIVADPDKYGKTASLVSGQLVSTTPPWKVLGAQEDVQLYAVDDAGDATGTIGGAGEGITVRVMYAQQAALP